MKVNLTPIDKTNAKIIDLAQAIQKGYQTGGKCLYHGVSPVDGADVFVYPDFTAVFTGDIDPEWGPSVDEWDSVVDQIKDDYEGKYIEVRSTFL